MSIKTYPEPDKLIGEEDIGRFTKSQELVWLGHDKKKNAQGKAVLKDIEW